MNRVQIGKIYTRCDGKLVYHKYFVALKVSHDDLIEGINVETGEPAFFNPDVLEKFYRIEK